jgi:hypothetical protein
VTRTSREWPKPHLTAMSSIHAIIPLLAISGRGDRALYAVMHRADHDRHGGVGETSGPGPVAPDRVHDLGPDETASGGGIFRRLTISNC